jgi:hypothetical protein
MLLLGVHAYQTHGQRKKTEPDAPHPHLSCFHVSRCLLAFESNAYVKTQSSAAQGRAAVGRAMCTR